MIERRKSKLSVEYQNKKFVIDARVSLTTRQIITTIILIILIGLLGLAAVNEELKKYVMEITIGVFQTILADFISRK